MLKELIDRIAYGDFERSLYTEFRSVEEADAWADSLYRDWYRDYKEHLNVQDTNPLTQYFGYESGIINHYIMTGENAGIDRIRSYPEAIRCAIYDAPRIDRNLIVYRHIPGRIISNLDRAGFCYEWGFMSTTMLKTVCADISGSDVDIFRIYLPKGFPAIYANVVSFRPEYELLLPDGISLEPIGYPYKDKETGKNIYEVRPSGQY